MDSSDSDSESDILGITRRRNRVRSNIRGQELEDRINGIAGWGNNRPVMPGILREYYLISSSSEYRIDGIDRWMDEIMNFIAIPNVREIYENLQVFYRAFSTDGTTHFRHESNRLHTAITRLVAANPPATPYILECIGSIFWNALAYTLDHMNFEYGYLTSDEESLQHTYRTMMRLTNTLLDRVIDDMEALLPDPSSYPVPRLPLYRDRQSFGSDMRELRQTVRESSNERLRIDFIRLDLILSIVMMYIT